MPFNIEKYIAGYNKPTNTIQPVTPASTITGTVTGLQAPKIPTAQTTNTAQTLPQNPVSSLTQTFEPRIDGGPQPPAINASHINGPPQPPVLAVDPGVNSFSQQAPGSTWLDSVSSHINDWRNQGMAYNNQMADRMAQRYRVSGDDIANIMSQAANARAGSGIMGGTEAQNLLGNLLGGLRRDTQAMQTQGYQNAWGQNSALRDQTAAAGVNAMNAAQQGATQSQMNTQNLIANAIMQQPGASAISLQLLASLLGLGQESGSANIGGSSSESIDPTRKYEIIAGLI